MKCRKKGRFVTVKELVTEQLRSFLSRIKAGSLTVELSLIFPVVLLSVFSCLYLCFYVHNRAFLTAAAYESAVCGSIAGVKETGTPYETARERSILLGSTGFFGAEDLHTYTLAGTESGDPITVFYEMDSAFDYFVRRRHLRTEGSAEIIRPAADIRDARRGY